MRCVRLFVDLAALAPARAILWGHYRFLYIYFGLPVTLITLCATLTSLAPARLCRPLALRLTAMCVTSIMTVLAGDLIFSLFLVGGGPTTGWIRGTSVGATPLAMPNWASSGNRTSSGVDMCPASSALRITAPMSMASAIRRA